RHVGRRLGHAMISCRDDAGDRRARASRRSARPRERDRESSRGRAAKARACRRCPPPGPRVLVGRHWPPVARDLSACHRRVARDARGGRVNLPAITRNPWLRVAVVLAAAAGLGTLVWWRGPNWGQVGNAFTIVRWEWVVA